jgi:diaminohydroxyphosphoribosylaminopyrimidine deaminase/5-amino-6-(5-phosphoribosylamino)uracil reductase
MKEGWCTTIIVHSWHRPGVSVFCMVATALIEQAVAMIVREFQEQAMQLAIAQALSVAGRTSPNPAVGAVVVNHGDIVGRGGTQPPGQAHAERVALQEAGERARGGDLYVTFEPCTFHGRTPPCTDAIIAAGIKRVFYLCRDTDPRMGVGADTVLQAQGIETYHLDLFQQQLVPLVGPFLMRTRQQRPWVTLKYAMSIDGKIATHSGVSQWISGAESRHEVHHLRDQVDAIITGSGTVISDNPQLTTRIADPQRPPRNPLRVVIDGSGRTPTTAQIYTCTGAATHVFCTTQSDPHWRAQLQAQGVHVHLCDSTPHVDLHQVMAELNALQINHVMIEAGAGLAGALHDADLIDEIRVFMAPGIIGNTQAPGPVGGAGATSLIDINRYKIVQAHITGNDVAIRAYHRQRIAELFARQRISAPPHMATP